MEEPDKKTNFVELDAVKVEDIKVTPTTSPNTSKINTDEFCKALYKELYEGKVWRSSKALAEKMNVDVVELDSFLRSQNSLCCRTSKDEGVFLYALLKRVEDTNKKEGDKNENLMRALVTEEDRYAIAFLHSAFVLLESTLQKYALKIHERNPEAFTNLMAGKNKIEAGIVLLATKTKADLSKLPKV